MGLLARSVMVTFGVAILVVHAALAVAGLVAVQWLFANPPGVLTLLAVFVVVVFTAGYIGYRIGSLQLVASLDGVEIPVARAPELYRRLERLCLHSRIEQPRLLVADLGAPNALSIGGPRRGVVVFDQRLVELLTIDEFEGVLAHELAHMERMDTFWNTLAITAVRTVLGVVSLLLFPVVIMLVGIDRAGGWIAGDPRRKQIGLAGFFQQVVLLLLAGLLFVFTIVFYSYSRKQEFAADRRASELTGKPVALARALAKINRATMPRRGLFSLLYIHDERAAQQERWLSTHPPIDDRIDRLLAETETSQQQYVNRIRP